MRRILFLSKGLGSASTRYRALSYFSSLKNSGWSPSHMSLHEGFVSRVSILRAARKADVVVLVRHGLSFPYLQLLRAASNNLVFDFDDAIYSKSDGSVSVMREGRFDRTVARCDRVWAGNQFLERRALEVNRETAVLPTSVDMTRYDIDTSKPETTIDLVWIGSSSTAKYLRDIIPVLEQAAVKQPRLRLKIIADFSVQSSKLSIEAIPWTTECEIPELKSSHIGIAPMWDDPWTRGKCALKVLQYMASHLPVISSHTGTNSEVVEHGKTGFLVSSDSEWIDAISMLANSPSLREEMGVAGYSRCDETYSTRVCAAAMLSQLESITAGT